MKPASRLPVNHRIAVRALADGETLPEHDLRALQNLGLVDDSGSLTNAGRSEHNRIMASGDGPEDLKEMLRF